MNRSTHWIAVAVTLVSCTNAGDVLTTKPRTPQDAGVDADAASPPDAAVEADAGEEDRNMWTRLPGLYGGWFRHVGGGEATSFLTGRRLDETQLSLYRLDASLSSAEITHPEDEEGNILFPPIGALGEVSGRLFWATDSDGITASDDGGHTWASLELPWQDGSVGEGNGHVSRIVHAWTSNDAFCVHREVQPWIDYNVRRDLLHGEVRCLRGEQWTVHTSSLAEGVRFFTARDEQLYGFTAPLYNTETGTPKLCHSSNLGADWTCRNTDFAGHGLHVTESGRLVIVQIANVERPTPTVETRVWQSEDHGFTFTLAATVPAPLFEVTLVGDVLYGLPYYSSVDIIDGDLHIVHLSDQPRVETGLAPTRAQITRLSMFSLGGVLLVADTRGVRRYVPGEDRWYDVAVESMPALALMEDGHGAIWTIDGGRIARRLRDGESRWEEHFFDDTGWATGDVVHHARVHTLARAGDKLFFGAAHRKLYVASTGVIPIPMEDPGLTGVLHPDGIIWRMAGGPDALYIAATGGEEVNHGTGSRIPWGGGLYRRVLSTGAWTEIGQTLPARNVGAVPGRPIISAIHAAQDLLLVATHTGVHRSTDRGSTWTSVAGIAPFDATEDPVSIAGANDRVLVARSNGAIYLSEDRGATFRAASDDLPQDGEIRAMVATEDAYFALVQPNGVFQSEDGELWDRVGEADAPLFARAYSLLVLPDRIVVGTAEGVFALER